MRRMELSARPGSPSPEISAKTPIATMTSRPAASTIVSTTFTLTDSEMPAKLISVTSARKISAPTSTGMLTNSAR